tara:strand:- start:116 stop:382 length:267 start_codon:yes stop_codon:yes gene_type:complete
MEGNTMKKTLFLAMLAVLAFPIIADGRPEGMMKARKVRKTLKKIKRLDDIYYIPLYRDYDMDKVAGSSTNESDFSNFSNTRKCGFGQV